MKLLTAVVLFAAVASAQDMPANASIASAQGAAANPLITVSKSIYAMTAESDVLRSVDKIPDALWSYQPTKAVRTVAQLFAHIADAQYEFCGLAAEGKSISKNIESTRKTKAEIVPALKEAFAYCDAAYAKLTDASAADMVPFMGLRITKLGAMDLNISHTMEHYGNLVTYMRINGIVPPSSEQQPPPPAKKQ
jgi:uncharacterized damage-inducible protein DinB